MTPEALQLLQSRPLWKVSQDPLIQDLKAARAIAEQENDTASIAVIDDMIKQQTEIVLNKQ